ncbi:HAD-IC family P-type ATPase [Kocuria massiliensis]|uniref:HAD-IC family P-type ATPase n=1 Tax=Kocuria massiliensis TaxID=1926282 RepID=UPI000A1C997A|nr:HAD-IC family P-type ATPase [Kocuria massiliensis]
MPAARPQDATLELSRDDAQLARTGLTSDEVASRTARGLTNHQPNTTSRSVWAIVRTHLFTLFNLTLGACAAVIIVLGRWLDLLFSLAALANIVIGFVQEFSAKRQLDKIALLRQDPARVLRDGEIVQVTLEQIVLDDVLLLSRGDQVPADAVVLTADGLDLDESLLTGENDPVVKQPGDKVFSAASVVGGSGRVRVTAVGERSHASRLAKEARQFAPINSELRAATERVVTWISIGLIPIIAIVLNGQMQAVGGWHHAFETGEWRDALVVAVSSVASMVPQGLALMTTISFAVAAVKLARAEVLIQEQPAVEVLARVDTVCFDKTGTLTEGGVTFDQVHPLAGGNELTESAREALAHFGHDPHANPTAAALAPAFETTSGVEPSGRLAFSSANRFSGLEFASSGAWLLGAPEVLLDQGPALDRALELASQGMRTMVLASADALIRDDDERPVQKLPDRWEAVALLTFREQVRSDAAETLAYFTEQGIDLKVFSGDNPATVAAAARLAGMDLQNDAVDASALPEDGDELTEAALNHHVFGRVSPHQKKNMVTGLQERGRVVAMTGDGINDALALKHADLGIAMGNAAPATKAVSRLVLLDGKFSRLPSVLAEGRKIIANIERVTNLFLTKTTFAIMMGLALGLLAWTFPFLPRQYSTADLLMIGGPSFVLTMLPNNRRYVGGFLRRSLHFAVPSAVVVTLCVVGINYYAKFLAPDGMPPTRDVQTANFIVLVLVGLWILCVGSRPLSAARWTLLLGMYMALVLVLLIPISLTYHQFTLPGPQLLAAALIIAAVGSVLIEINFWVHRRWMRQHQPVAFRAGVASGEV